MSVSEGGSHEKGGAGAPWGRLCCVGPGLPFIRSAAGSPAGFLTGREYDSTLIFRNARTLAVSSCREDRGKKRGRLHLEATAVVLGRGHVRIAQLGEGCAAGGWE